jgi:Flp pilus assembly protein TadD
MERAFTTSARDNPNYDFMAVNYAAVLIQSGHMDGALNVLNSEITESPSYSRAWSNRAVIHYKQGQTAPARTDAEKALELDPTNTQAQNLLRALGSPASPKPKK